MMKDEYIPLAEIVEELENGSRPEGGVNDSGDVFSVGGEHLNDFGGFDFSSVKLISHDFYNQMKRGKVKPDDIIIVKDGATTGKTSFVNEQFPHFPCAINEHVFRLAINQKIADPRYVFYYLYSHKGNKEILDDFRGATVGGISQDFVNKVFIPLPPLTEQKRIASLLRRADRLRHLRRTAHELGESLLQSVFLEMFGDVAINSKNWKKIELGDALDIITYGLTVRPEYIEKGIPLISAREIRSGIVEFGDAPRISEKDFSETYDKGKPQKGDILFSKTGTIGSCAEVTTDETFAITQNVARLCFKKKLVNNAFAIQYLRTPFFQEMAKEASKGNAVQDLQLGVMQQFPFYIPPLNLQEEFAGVVARVESLRGRMSEGERQVEGLFESLLSESFGG